MHGKAGNTEHFSLLYYYYFNFKPRLFIFTVKNPNFENKINCTLLFTMDKQTQHIIRPTGCHKYFLNGYPTFYEVFSNSSPGFIVLTVFLTLSTLANISLYSYGTIRAKRNIESRFSSYILKTNAILPVILGVCAYLTAMAPRLYGMVNIFSSLFFVVSMYSFSKMVFEYFGGINKCVEKLAEKNLCHVDKDKKE